MLIVIHMQLHEDLACMIMLYKVPRESPWFACQISFSEWYEVMLEILFPNSTRIRKSAILENNFTVEKFNPAIVT